MNKLKMLVLTALAAATVGIGALAAAPSASAAISCTEAIKLSATYGAQGDFFEYYVGGAYGRMMAMYWYGKSEAILLGAC
jgi:hypothetical protein